MVEYGWLWRCGYFRRFVMNNNSQQHVGGTLNENVAVETELLFFYTKMNGIEAFFLK